MQGFEEQVVTVLDFGLSAGKQARDRWTVGQSGDREFRGQREIHAVTVLRGL